MIFGSLYRYIYYHTPLIKKKNLTLVSISNLRKGHYVHINNTFSLSPTAVEVQQKILLNSIHSQYVAILALPNAL